MRNQFKTCCLVSVLILGFSGVSLAQPAPEHITVDPQTVEPRVEPRFVEPVPTLGFNVPEPEKIAFIGEEIPEEVFKEFARVFGREKVGLFRNDARGLRSRSRRGIVPTLMMVYQPWIGFAFIDAHGSPELEDFIAAHGIGIGSTTNQPSEINLQRAGVLPTEDQTAQEIFTDIIEGFVDDGVHRAAGRVSLAQLLGAMRGDDAGATIDDVVALVGGDTDLVTLEGVPLLYAPVRGLDYDPEGENNNDYPNFLTLNRETERVTVDRWLAQKGLYLERCIEPSDFTGGTDEFGNAEIANNPRLDTEDVVRAETLHIIEGLPNSLYSVWSDVYIESERALVRNTNRGSNRNQGGFPNVVLTDRNGNAAATRSLRFCSLDCFVEADTRQSQPAGAVTSPTGSRIYRSIFVYKTAREGFSFFSNLLGPARDAQGGLVTNGPFIKQRGMCPV